jgi:hypothetical protein
LREPHLFDKAKQERLLVRRPPPACSALLLLAKARAHPARERDAFTVKHLLQRWWDAEGSPFPSHSGRSSIRVNMRLVWLAWGDFTESRRQRSQQRPAAYYPSPPHRGPPDRQASEDTDRGREHSSRLRKGLQTSQNTKNETQHNTRGVFCWPPQAARTPFFLPRPADLRLGPFPKRAPPLIPLIDNLSSECPGQSPPPSQDLKLGQSVARGAAPLREVLLQLPPLPLVHPPVEPRTHHLQVAVPAQ